MPPPEAPSPSPGRLGRALSLALPLAAFWLILSGHYTGLLLALGLVSVLLVVWIVRRMVAADGTDVDLRPSPRAPGYAVWLTGQVLVSSWAVFRQVWSLRPDPRPVVGVTPAGDLSEQARVGYANSITLTPGTLSLQVLDEGIEVHALRESGLQDLRAGGMHDRVRRLEAR